MRNQIKFLFRGKVQTVEFDDNLPPTTTVLEFLRNKQKATGVKEGCAEGDCGACTVVVAELDGNKLKYKALNSCVMFLPSLNGKFLITIEDLEETDRLHPIQVALIENHASQCGFCTPGFTMALFGQIKQNPHSTYDELKDAITGNLCRCTGYKSIAQAAKSLVGKKITDKFDAYEPQAVEILQSLKNDELIDIQTDKYRYFIPKSVQQALKLKKEHPQAVFVNGGTDLVLAVKKKKIYFPVIIDLSQIAELQKFEISGNEIFVGAGVKIEDFRLAIKDHLPQLAEFLLNFGAKQIRNASAVAGNIATASPVGDLTMAFMTLNAQVILTDDNNNQRKLPLDNFITGYRKTDLKDNELITGFAIPKPIENQAIDLYKISKRKKLDISTVSAGFNFTISGGKISGARIVYGGMAEMTKHAVETENFLKNKPFSEETFLQAAEVVEKEFSPIDDARSSAQARTIMAKNLLLKFFYTQTQKN